MTDRLEGGRIFKVKLNTDLRKVLFEETGLRGDTMKTTCLT